MTSHKPGTLLFLTSGLGDNIVVLPLALELEEQSRLVVVAWKGPQQAFFQACLPEAEVISYDRSLLSRLRVIVKGWGCRFWIYPVGASSLKLRLLHLAAFFNKTWGFKILESRRAWLGEIGFEKCLTPDFSKPAWKNNLKLLSAVGEPSGKTWDDYTERLRGRLARSPVEEGLLIIHAGSARYPGGLERYKRWPLENFMEVSRRMIQEGRFRRVAFFLGPDELNLLGPLRSAIEASPVKKAIGIVLAREFKGDLQALGAYFSSARHFLSNDTGLAHLASLYGTAMTVAISGLGEPAYNAQNGSGVRLLIQRADCFGCCLGISAGEAEEFECRNQWVCMTKITADMACRAVAR